MVRKKKEYFGLSEGEWVVEVEVAVTDELLKHVINKFTELGGNLTARKIIITYSITSREAEEGEVLGLKPFKREVK